ncbi:MAG: 2TM domain-containing protein [Oligoflexales bacterium]|nr:2TM domain-containing protein [Oligoflexales bacterium]
MHLKNYFKANLAIYIVINILLVIINLSYSPQHIWFHYPLFGWGCLMAVLYLVSSRYPSEDMKCKGRGEYWKYKAHKIYKDAFMENGEGAKEHVNYKEYKNKCMEKGKSLGFRCHLAVYLLITALLVITNLQYTPNILWSIYVIFGWGAGVFAHYYFFKSDK